MRRETKQQRAQATAGLGENNKEGTVTKLEASSGVMVAVNAAIRASPAESR